uniref:Uncharacterized protein n=1 Tax=Oryza punctata TaxID=4537 RepID=A0A0E0LN34_ORYPU
MLKEEATTEVKYQWSSRTSGTGKETGKETDDCKSMCTTVHAFNCTGTAEGNKKEDSFPQFLFFYIKFWINVQLKITYYTSAGSKQLDCVLCILHHA